MLTLSRRKYDPEYVRPHPRKPRKRAKASRTPAATQGAARGGEEDVSTEEAVNNPESEEPLTTSPFDAFDAIINDPSTESSSVAYVGKGKAAARIPAASTVAKTAPAGVFSGGFPVPQSVAEPDDDNRATDEIQNEEAEYDAYLDTEASRAALTTLTNDLGAAALAVQTRLAELTSLVILAPGNSPAPSASGPASEQLTNEERIKTLEAYKHALRSYMHGKIEWYDLRPKLMYLMQINRRAQEQHDRIVEAMREFQRQKGVFKDTTGLELPLKYRDV